MGRPGQLRCCEFCGRDTRSACGICFRCLGNTTHRNHGSRLRDPRENLGRSPHDAQPMDHEDDYSEDGGPDSVCQDHSGG